jgi:prepilin-type N-terminal cleavage/methylation domain-containing protein
LENIKINKKGFTLIELIVVLAILGLILAIAVPNYMSVQAKATETADTREAELLADFMKRALVDGSLVIENKKLKGVMPEYDSDGEIIGFKKQKFVGTGRSFDKAFVPVAYQEAPSPEDPDAGNDRSNSDLQRYMFEVLDNKVKIWVGSETNKTYLAEFSY